ncbi:hypothetical protein QAD02_017911 [Eretmocerus hayati]|uniref:Uncharacterized protein n=1 Tax=Eretmocerus hayati TaxID=131215 RepID=A0ACC2PEY1_9HYME|nr:hypothetical protein QAD02_017911 [Eretmocerus hayati]
MQAASDQTGCGASSGRPNVTPATTVSASTTPLTSPTDNQTPPCCQARIDIDECLASWLTYLQMLNGLCSAGTRLALSLKGLLSAHDGMGQCRVTGQCLAGWEELTRATNVASHTVKKHVLAAMKDYEILDNDAEKYDILRDNLLTFINLQYQFCVACCKCLGSMAECSCTQDGSECDIAALQQCFERLYSSPTPPASSSTQHPSSHRSPLPYSLFPLQIQRRWSETAAADMSAGASGESLEQQVRRWSMPWDCRHTSEWPRQEVRTRLRVPQPEPSRSTTPDSLWKSAMTSQDGLREAIQLLSCKPGVRLSNQQMIHGGQHVPGVTLTTCSYETIGYESAIWPDSRAVSSSRCWPHDSHSSDHSDLSGPRGDSDHSAHSGEHRDSEHSVGSGSAHGDSKDSIHSHSDYSCQGHRESDPGVIDLLSSRKNSSSTDSCVSAHSRSGSESAAGAGESVRSNLYSMWSGSDLPFIKLPESSEMRDHSTM